MVERAAIFIALLLLGLSLPGRLPYLFVYALALWLITFRWKMVTDVAAETPLLVLVLLFPLLSVLWSVEPVESFQHAVAVMLPSIIGIYLGRKLNAAGLLLTFAGVYAAMALLDFAVAAALPSIGRMNGTEWNGAWKGLHGHKTGLGKAALMASLFAIFAITATRGRQRIFHAAVLLVSLLLIWQAKSLAAWVMLALALGFMGALWLAKRQAWHGLGIYASVALGLAGLLLLAFSVNGASPFLEALGKSDTMSSRLPLWQESWVSVMARPWLGYGFSAFWDSSLPDIARIRSALRFEPHYSHNGFIEMLLEGGALFAACFLMLFAASLWRSFRPALEPGWQPAFPLVFFLIFLLSNIPESSVLSKNSLFWLIFVACAAHVARLGKRETAREPRYRDHHPRPFRASAA